MKAKRKQDMFNRADLNFYKLERAHLNGELKSRTILQETWNELNEQKEKMEYWIATLTVEQNQLKQDVSSTRDIFTAASKALKEFQSKKTIFQQLQLWKTYFYNTRFHQQSFMQAN